MRISINATITVQGPIGQGGNEILDQLRDIKDLLTQMGNVEVGIAQQEFDMSKTTDDLAAAVQALTDNSVKIDAAIDQLVSSAGDQAAVQTAITNLQSLKADQDTHLSNLVPAAQAVVTAPADPSGASAVADAGTPSDGSAPSA